MLSWEEVTAAVGSALGGGGQEARDQLHACWESTDSTDHAQRCVIAHYLADLQPVLEDEVIWDERALAAHAHVGVDDLVPVGISEPLGMAPSLHLNLGDGYLRQGRIDEAQAHLASGMEAIDALSDDGYGDLIRNGLSNLSHRITAARDAEVRIGETTARGTQ